MPDIVSVVVPVFNSKNSLKELCYRIKDTIKSYDLDFEILFVDDGSIDGSYEKMKELYNTNDNIRIFKLKKNFGQQNALMCGLKFAKGKYVVTIDDDLQHPPEEIGKILYKLKEGYDVVYGIPEQKKHSFIRNIGSKMTDYLFEKMCRKPGNIRVSSFRVMSDSTVKRIISDKTPFVYISAMLFKANVKMGNVTVNHESRKEGRSNYNFFKLIKLFFKLYYYYSDTPLKKLASDRPQYVIEEKRI